MALIYLYAPWCKLCTPFTRSQGSLRAFCLSLRIIHLIGERFSSAHLSC